MPPITQLLMTGGTGSIGPTLISRLLESNWEITLLGRSKPSINHERLHFKAVDLGLGEIPDELVRGLKPDVVLHMANLSKSAPDKDLQISERLATIAIDSGARHFFYSSSIRVYGDMAGDVCEAPNPTPLANDAYGLSKLAVEKNLQQILKNLSVSLRILRIGQVVSEQAKTKTPTHLSFPYLLVWGKAFPHYVHLDDASSAIFFLLEHRDRLRHRIYDIAVEPAKPIRFNTIYAEKLSSLHSSIVRHFALPPRLAQLIFRSRPEARGTRAGLISGRNLADEGWRPGPNRVLSLFR